MPQVDESLSSLKESCIFSALDVSSGCWQIKIDDHHKDKTIFTFHHVLYRFLWMCFGLKNARSTFQRMMRIKPSKVNWQLALIYLDDIFIISGSVEGLMDCIQTVLRLLSATGV